jgi:hypothetical protein
LIEAAAVHSESSLQVAVESEGRRFKSRGPQFYLRKFLRNAPASNHQFVEVDLNEDGTISRISNAYSFR